MAEARRGEICIADLTGARTFADERSPLFQALQEHQGEAANLADEYRVRIDRAVRFCERLGEKTPSQLRSIEVREYDRPAIWKMVIFGNYLWLQHYVAGKLE